MLTHRTNNQLAFMTSVAIAYRNQSGGKGESGDSRRIKNKKREWFIEKLGLLLCGLIGSYLFVFKSMASDWTKKNSHLIPTTI